MLVHERWVDGDAEGGRDGLDPELPVATSEFPPVPLMDD